MGRDLCLAKKFGIGIVTLNVEDCLNLNVAKRTENLLNRAPLQSIIKIVAHLGKESQIKRQMFVVDRSVNCQWYDGV